MTDDERIQKWLPRLKMAGATFADEAFFTQAMKGLIEELRAEGNLGKMFIQGYNIGLTEAADAIGWNNREHSNLRDKVLALRKLPTRE